MNTCNIDDCNIYSAQFFLKHKWIPIIIYIMQDDEITFSYLLNKIEHISNKRLSEALKLLLEREIIIKEDNLYFLSATGEQLLEIILLMSKFTETISLKNH